jgi:hypothetical protein
MIQQNDSSRKEEKIIAEKKWRSWGGVFIIINN